MFGQRGFQTEGRALASTQGGGGEVPRRGGGEVHARCALDPPEVAGKGGLARRCVSAQRFTKGRAALDEGRVAGKRPRPHKGYFFAALASTQGLNGIRRIPRSVFKGTPDCVLVST